MKELYPIKRVLVALDRTSHDDVLFAYTSILGELTDLDCVYFMHVADNLEIPEDILKNFPDLLAPVDESIKKNIKYEVEKLAQLKEGVKTEILIREGNTYKEILKAIEQKQIDLLIMGRKSDKIAKINIVKRVVRSAPCSISLIPEYVPGALKKVLVPIDFSQNSVMALQDIELLVKKYPEMEVVAFHAYSVPSGYTKIGKSFDEFSQIMLQNAQKESDRFFKSNLFDIPNLTHSFFCREGKSLPSLIYQFAVANSVDTIVMGARGRDSISRILLGSVTESLIEHDQYLPIMIIKSKQDYMGLKEALLNL